VDLGALLTEVVGETAETMREKNLRVELDLGQDPAIVLGDRPRLKQAFRNLVDNAEKFSDPSGTIRLQLTRDETGIITRIQDTGIGIPEEEQDKIFDTFYQVDGSSTRPYPGLGIGLAIVREIIELHGGSIDVQSEMGEGAQFVVRMPSSDQRESELAAAQADADQPPAIGEEDAVTTIAPDPSQAPQSGEIDTAISDDETTSKTSPEEEADSEDQQVTTSFESPPTTGGDDFEEDEDTRRVSTESLPPPSGDYADEEEGTTEFQPTKKFIAKMDLKQKPADEEE
jgi:hypothetical protein